MKKIVLTFGLIAGAILAAIGVVLAQMCVNGTMDPDKSEILGYSSMVLAFLLTFFGIRSYRDNVNGGTISFGKGFQVGILMTLIACAVYVVSWEIVYYNFIPDFADKYAANVIRRMEEKGESPAKIQQTQQEMTEMKRMIRNPLINAGLTFMEVFPVGLIVTLVSAAILRRKSLPEAPSAGAVATA
jgi:hypothetical protein